VRDRARLRQHHRFSGRRRSGGAVVEVQYDHFSQGRFRHGTRFLRWRPDKAPAQCTLEQVEQNSGVAPISLA